MKLNNKALMVFITTLWIMFCYIKVKKPQQNLKCLLFKRNCALDNFGGKVAKGFEGVKEVYEQLFEEGLDAGSQLVAYYKGEKVVDLYAGYTKKKNGVPYTNNTLTIAFSCSKVLESLTVAMLVDRGLLNYTEKITSYWPTFPNGDVTLEQVMKYEARLPHITLTSLKEALDDPDYFRRIIEETPLIPYTPNTRAYHAYTRGLILNEVIKQATEKSIGQWLQEEINNIDTLSYYMGNFPEHMEALRADIHEISLYEMIFKVAVPTYLKPFRHYLPMEVQRFFRALIQSSSLTHKSLFVIPKKDRNYNAKLFRSIELPSANGHTNAYTLATVANAMLHKGVFNHDNTALFQDPHILEMAESKPVNQFDIVLQKNTTVTRGGFGRIGQLVGWNGMGGSTMRWDHQHELAYSYVMNTMEPFPYKRVPRLEKALYEAILKN